MPTLHELGPIPGFLLMHTWQAALIRHCAPAAKELLACAPSQLTVSNWGENRWMPGLFQNNNCSIKIKCFSNALRIQVQPENHKI